MGRTAATQRGLSGSGYRFRVYPDGMSLGYVFVLFFCGAPFCTCFILRRLWFRVQGLP